MSTKKNPSTDPIVRQIKKVAKNKSSFPNEQSLFKSLLSLWSTGYIFPVYFSLT